MENKNSQELVKQINEIKNAEKKAINKLAIQYISIKADWCLSEMEEIHRLAITEIISNIVKYMLEKNYDCYYEAKDNSKFFVLGINYEDEYLTAFNFEKIINNNFEEIANEITTEITTDEERTIKYIDSEGIRYCAPTFFECEHWIETILENLQDGNL